MGASQKVELNSTFPISTGDMVGNSATLPKKCSHIIHLLCNASKEEGIYPDFYTIVMRGVGDGLKNGRAVVS